MLTRKHRTVVVAASVASIVLAANGSDGAYFSQSWGWVALAFLVPTTVLLILDRVAVPGRLRIAFASSMGALGLWVALSATWSISSSASVREVERMLVYVALALAVALVLRRGDGPGVVAGALGGIALTSAYGLGTRLFPDWFDAYDDPINLYRLAEPLGYWNALGLLSSMGLVLAIGVVAHARRASVAAIAAAPIPVLALTLYFTFSRGAWAALALGIGAAIAADPRRLRLTWTALVVCLPSGICVLYASQARRADDRGRTGGCRRARRAPRRRCSRRRHRSIRRRGSRRASSGEAGHALSEGAPRLRPRSCGIRRSRSRSQALLQLAARRGSRSASMPNPSPKSI